MLWGQQ